MVHNISWTKSNTVNSARLASTLALFGDITALTLIGSKKKCKCKYNLTGVINGK